MLFTVLVIGIVGLAALAALVQIALSTIDSAEQRESAFVATELTYSCMDEVIAQLIRDDAFVETTINIGSQNCAATITSNDTLRDVTLSATVGPATKTLEFTFDLENEVITALE